MPLRGGPLRCGCGRRPGEAVTIKGPGSASLEREPFAFQATKDGRVFLFFDGRHVETLAGTDAAKFIARIEGVDAPQAQLMMARATKNFRRGNERSGKRRRGR